MALAASGRESACKARIAFCESDIRESSHVIIHTLPADGKCFARCLYMAATRKAAQPDDACSKAANLPDTVRVFARRRDGETRNWECAPYNASAQFEPNVRSQHWAIHWTVACTAEARSGKLPCERAPRASINTQPRRGIFNPAAATFHNQHAKQKLHMI